MQDWGGLKRVPRSDPRVANDPRWNNVEVPVSPGGDSLPDLPSGAEDDPTEGMDISSGSGSRAPPGDGDVDMTEARAAGPGGGGNNPVSKETPILRGQAPSYGLQETHTTICPFNGWFSVVNPSISFATPIVAEFRVTSPIDPFVKNLSNTVAPAVSEYELKSIPISKSLAFRSLGL